MQDAAKVCVMLDNSNLFDAHLAHNLELPVRMGPKILDLLLTRPTTLKDQKDFRLPWTQVRSEAV